MKIFERIKTRALATAARKIQFDKDKVIEQLARGAAERYGRRLEHLDEGEIVRQMMKHELTGAIGLTEDYIRQALRKAKEMVRG